MFRPKRKMFPIKSPIYIKISEKMKELHSYITLKHIYTEQIDEVDNNRAASHPYILKCGFLGEKII